ncbi:MAG: cyclic nucleotide-binding domain-containing protein [Bacteroidota bacterium]
MTIELQILNRELGTNQFLTKDEISAFSGIWSPFSNKRKEMISRAGENEKYLYFVLEGIQRIYSMHAGKETVLVFTYPYSLGGVADAFLLQEKSSFFYESLTPSRFLRTSYHQFEEISKQLPNVALFFNKQVYRAFSGLLHRMVELQSFSSEEKFKALLKRSPHILQLVPHKYIANYLGMDPTNFSKLINTIAI